MLYDLYSSQAQPIRQAPISLFERVLGFAEFTDKSGSLLTSENLFGVLVHGHASSSELAIFLLLCIVVKITDCTRLKDLHVGKHRHVISTCFSNPKTRQFGVFYVLLSRLDLQSFLRTPKWTCPLSSSRPTHQNILTNIISRQVLYYRNLGFACIIVYVGGEV